VSSTLIQHHGIFQIYNNNNNNKRYETNKEDDDDNDIIHVSFPIHTNVRTVHEYFMQRALHQAQRAGSIYSEVPIGALVVRNRTDTTTTTTGIPLESSSNSNTRTTQHHISKEPQPQPQQRYEILSQQHNRVELNYDASAHAELLAMRHAAQRIQNWRLNYNPSTATTTASNTTASTTTTTILYSTLEPCIMCCAAAHAFRINHIVYGAPDVRLGGCCTTSYMNLIDKRTHPFHTISHVTSGIYANESSALLRDFFRERRKSSAQTKAINSPERSVSSSTTEERTAWLRRLVRQLLLPFRLYR
jgi:tRNA(adenine34) deaminase